jgi:hypothetical protein
VVSAGPAGAVGWELGEAVAVACAAAGAAVARLVVDPAGDEVAPPQGAPAPVLVWDADAAFAAAGEPSVRAVHAALDGAWLAIRAVAVARPGGKVALLAPRPGGPHHEAARAGLENLARTTAIEWSRLGTRIVAVLPGATTEPAEVAGLVGYLASRAGDYVSGCPITLGSGPHR